MRPNPAPHRTAAAKLIDKYSSPRRGRWAVRSAAWCGGDMRQRFIATGALVLLFAVSAWVLWVTATRPRFAAAPGADRQASDLLPEGEFPELQPDLDAPPGYAWVFRDGPDFYTWVLAEGEKVGRRHPSGVGIYFGLHPNVPAAERSSERVPGRVCGTRADWLVERTQAGNEPWVRRDAVIEYEHGPGFLTIALHVWVWGRSEEQVAELARQVEELSFSLRARRRNRRTRCRT
jgi:hypothetical protein